MRAFVPPNLRHLQCLCALPCIPIFMVVCGKKRGEDSPYRSGFAVPCLLFCVAYAGVIVFWAYDWILIVSSNGLPDAQGYALYADLYE